MEHFFMFSEGSYPDYMVGGLYRCDHEVTEEEWEAHLATHEAAYKAKRFEVFGPGCDEFGAWRNYTEAQHLRLGAWMKANDPEEAFIAKHNMVPVEYLELWRRHTPNAR